MFTVYCPLLTVYLITTKTNMISTEASKKFCANLQEHATEVIYYGKEKDASDKEKKIIQDIKSLPHMQTKIQ